MSTVGTNLPSVLPRTFKYFFNRARSGSNCPETVENVQGWVKSVRLMKNMAFVDLQDGTTPHALKLVVRRAGIDSGEVEEHLQKLKTGQSVLVNSAMWMPTPTRQQPFELQAAADAVKVVGDVPATFPLQKKSHSLSFLRTQPTLKHRSNYLGALLRFRSFVELSFSQFFELYDCTKVAPPVLTSGDCEGAGELFRVEARARYGQGSKYFGRETYLTVSTQLHLEVLAAALSRCWTLSPCFRAEESDTNRHLAEFWMLETELSFVDNVHDLTVFAETMFKYVVQRCIDRQEDLLPAMVPSGSSSEDAKSVVQRWEALMARGSWPRVAYSEAITLLQNQHASQNFSFEPVWGQDLQTEHEKWLAAHFDSPVFITDYPRSCKAFYMKQNTDGRTVACFDLIVPQMGELIGGSVREDNYETLLQEMSRRNMNHEDLSWYTELRKNGSVPHGGFGLGLERFVAWLFGVHNIRDAIPFSRSAGGSIEL
ncbi:LAFA_0G16182g1_1 [Lachancea sp. 'fantastica']|nr:LAFA_0G16182g1_1 [Lachancea sp. 'fantastica']